MATHTVTAPAATTHQTLAANTADTVAFSKDFQRIEVLNRDAAADIYFRVDGTAPVIAADGTYIVQAGTSLQLDASDSQPGTTVKLISAAAAPYSVTGSN